jgi:hypothetical protein
MLQSPFHFRKLSLARLQDKGHQACTMHAKKNRQAYSDTVMEYGLQDKVLRPFFRWVLAGSLFQRISGLTVKCLANRSNGTETDGPGLSGFKNGKIGKYEALIYRKLQHLI